MVLGDAPGRERLAAASIMASWLGALAGERGATFPAQRNGLPARHAIVLATPSQALPEGLSLPEAQGPTVRLLRHPRLPHIKLLVLQGRNDAELRTAALGLILGRQGLSGPMARIETMAPIPLRPAYDAPNWVSTERPVRLGELVPDRAALQLQGTHADSVRVRWRTPPDLWLGPGRDARLDLRYRAALPSPTENTLLSLALNDSFVRAWRLTNTTADGPMGGLRRWLGGSDDVSGSVQLALSGFQPRYPNMLDVRLPLGVRPQTGNCAGSSEPTRASVDAESTLDFTALPHFLEMPDLAAFAGAGFPFTRYADLSQTAVVLPPQPDDREIETLLNLMGSFGRWTGTAAWHFALTTPDQLEGVRDRDLLLVGGSALHPLLEQWQPAPLLALREHQRDTRGPAVPVAPWRAWLHPWTGWETPAQTPVRLEAAGPLAIMSGFESPLTAS